MLVKLNDNELAGKGEELAAKVREEDAEQLAFAAWQTSMKESQKAKKEHLAELHRETSRLAAVVDAGKEERQVSCSWLYALSMGMAFLVRDDTGELVDHRELAEEERQVDLTEVLREPTPEQVGRFMGQIMAQRHVDNEEGEDDG